MSNAAASPANPAPPPTPLVDPKKTHEVGKWHHPAAIYRCKADRKARYVFAGTYDNSLIRWEQGTNAKTVLAGGHDTWVYSFAQSNDSETLLTGGSDGRIIWWPVAAPAPAPIRKIDAHQGFVWSLAVSPDGTLLASAGSDKLVKVWNIADGVLVKELPGQENEVYSVAFHPSGKSLVAGGLIAGVTEWEVGSWKPAAAPIDSKPFHDGNWHIKCGGVRSLAFSPGGKHLALAGGTKYSNPFGGTMETHVVLVEWDTKKVVRTFVAENLGPGFASRVFFLANDTIAAGTNSTGASRLVFWNIDADKDIHRVDLPSQVHDFDLFADGFHVAVAHNDHHLRLYKLAP